MDRYDAEIRRLLPMNENTLLANWNGAGPLFQLCNPSGEDNYPGAPGRSYGCPTQIRQSPGYIAWTEELTARIAADKRIPRDLGELNWDKLSREQRREALEVFAEYQREMDSTIRQPELPAEINCAPARKSRILSQKNRRSVSVLV